jgi:hypothetical protein
LLSRPRTSINILGIEDLLAHHLTVYGAVEAGSITGMASPAFLLDHQQYGIFIAIDSYLSDKLKVP